MRDRLRTVGLLILLAGATGAVFLQHPGLGDDFTYWRFALALTEKGPVDWVAKGFHALRWPVWGPSYLAVATVGPGLFSFYLGPFFYLALGTCMAFYLARAVLQTAAAGWLAAFAFVFHPLLDAVVYRPMPELPEAIFGAAAVAAWMALVEARTAAGRTGWAALCGLAVWVAFANRFTGVLIVPVLGLLMLGFDRRRWPWLLLCLGFALAFWALEAAVYWAVTGDFFRSIHANLGARGRKGTEAVPLWLLPFRFLDTLWQGSALGVSFLALTLLGIGVGWRSGQPRPRRVAAWAVCLFLGYSCALQGFSPPRPMIRDGPRFLGSLVIPLTVLAAAGALAGWRWWGARAWPPARRFRAWLIAHRRAAIGMAWAALALASARPFFNLDFVPEFRAYLATLPANTAVLTLKTVRELALLAGGRAASPVRWLTVSDLLEDRDKVRRYVARADQFWYSRRLLFLRERKAIQYGGRDAQRDLPPFVVEPLPDWWMARVIQIEQRPEFVFFRRRAAGDPEPLILGADSPVLGAWGLRLPLAVDGAAPDYETTVAIPEALRGRLLRWETRGAADEVEAFIVAVEFLHAGRPVGAFELKSHFYPEPALDFYAFAVPADAETARVVFRFDPKLRRLQIRDLRLIAF